MWIAVIVIAVVVGLYFAMDRRRYTGGGTPGGAGAGAAKPTPEVFRDPGTGRLMRVWVNDATGAREYREESGEPPRP